MQRRVTIITIVVMALLLVGVTTVIFITTNGSHNKQLSALSADVQKTQDDIDALKADKDSNGFTPTDVVKDFFNEVKSDAAEKAKLYLAPGVQSMDTKATLKLGSDYSNIATGDSFEEASDADKIVNMTFVLGTDDTTVRIFALSKYDGLWKITGITAE